MGKVSLHVNVYNKISNQNSMLRQTIVDQYEESKKKDKAHDRDSRL